MKIIPAIDLRKNEVVRLFQGDFNNQTKYNHSPVDLINHYQQNGMKMIHIVDLDGAKDPGVGNQKDFIIDIAKFSQLPIQTGGGIRDKEAVKKLFDNGINRVVIGSLAVKSPEMVQNWIDEFGEDRFVISLDVRFLDGWKIATHGWQKNSQTDLFEAIDIYKKYRNIEYLITDISKDGALSGPNFKLYEDVLRQFDVKVQASGGVNSLDDLVMLSKIGCHGVIVGKALLEGNIDIKETQYLFEKKGGNS